MATPILKATLRLARPPEMSKRAWRRITREALHAMALKWHREILPQHFTRSAPQKYGHQKRTEKYQKRKRAAAKFGIKRGGTRVYAKYGGNIDNVFSGELEQRVRAIAAIRATPTRVTLKITGPRYLTMRRFVGNRDEAVRKGFRYGHGQAIRDRGTGSGLQPDKARELTTVTAEENDSLIAFLNERVVARFNAWQSSRTA